MNILGLEASSTVLSVWFPRSWLPLLVTASNASIYKEMTQKFHSTPHSYSRVPQLALGKSGKASQVILHLAKTQENSSTRERSGGVDTGRKLATWREDLEKLKKVKEKLVSVNLRTRRIILCVPYIHVSILILK